MNKRNSASLEPLLYNTSEQNVTEIIDKINPKNAKKVAIMLVIVFILYHFYLHLKYGKDSCRWLFSDGHYKNDMGWQPYGCMMHVYTENDRMLCMKYLAYYHHQNTFVFLGDYQIKNMYLTFRDHFILTDKTSNENDKFIFDPVAKQLNLSYKNDDLCLQASFIWVPYISKTVLNLINEWKATKSLPSIIVIGLSTWSIKASNGSRKNLDEYSTNITLLLHSFEEICDKSRILWVLQAPVDEKKLNVSNLMITNEVIDQYNNAAVKVLKHSCVELWTSSKLIAQRHVSNMQEGIYLSAESLNIDIQLLLNMYCNNHMNPNDGTCCVTTEFPTYTQLASFSILFLCLICRAFMSIKPFYTYSLRYSNFRIVISSMAKLTLIMTFFYVCDRTNFFMKENKYYLNIGFWLPLGYIFTLGLFFTEDSRYTKIMNRDQTDEWKGWMQLIILIYQMTDAKVQLPIYNHILILVAAYIFLSGYGHFMYLWFRSDAGLLRFLQVLFRLNFLTVVLCFCMNRPYQFYYFIPVVTFWFSFLYIVFIFPPRVTSVLSEAQPIYYVYVIFKIIFLFISTCILYLSQVFFEKVFVTRPWKALFVTTDDDIENWWFRWKIDRFSALYGAAFAFFLLITQKFNFIDDNNHNNLFSARVSFFVAVLALLGLFATSTYAIICPSRFEYIDIQTYICILPIICYVLLRNVSGILRTRYSIIFAFFGRISLELFVSHFHIWLSADSHGILVLVPQFPVINILVVSYIYVCIAHELHCITKNLLPYAVPSDWKIALRNVFFFFVLLIPTGIRDGMF
ncbi:hypothetical protein PGB90_005327 [Kerria lacca]